ncbi:MAG: MATE family efflux transporter [Pseudobutyrivibrio sp.]|nr:MATE family efflux transporter [Pseudobutyrivibrio sp.]
MSLADQQTLQYKKMTETPIPSLIVKLGIPTTISMLVTSIYNVADTFFVGKYGTSASGAIGIVFGLMAIIQAFGFMYGQGSGSICSRALGAKDIDRASCYTSTAFFSALATSLFITIAGLIFLDPLMYLLGSTDTILPYARTYAIFILLAAPAMCCSCVLNNILRYEGQAAFAMIGLTSGGLINIFGDWLLMSKFNMGVMGAGIATAFSQYLSFSLLFSMFLRGKTLAKLSIKNVSFKPTVFLDICKTGLPAMMRQGLSSISTMLLNECASVYGDAAVAAMSIVNRICYFTFATTLGIGQGFQPVCGFNYGAKKYNRVRQAFLFTFGVGEVFLATTALLGIQFAAPLVAIFRDDPKVITIGTLALTVQFFGQVFQPVAVCSNMMFQSVGRVKTATLLSMLRSGLYFIPTLLILSSILGLLGVQISQAISDILTTLTAIPYTVKFLHELKIMEANNNNENQNQI